MKSIFALVLVIVIALSAHQVLGDVCTEETCTRTTSVIQYFQTPNCTGEYTLEPDVVYNVTCENFNSYDGHNTSRRYSCSNNAFTTAYHMRPNCAGSSLAVDSTPTGVCARTGDSSSQVHWCNAQSVKTSIKAVKAPQNTTILGDDYLCNPNVTTGCTGNTGTAYVFREPGCKLSNFSEVVRPSLVFGYEFAATLGTCYVNNQTDSYDNRHNYLASCENGRYTLKTFTGGCGSGANLLFTESVVTDQCFQYASNLYLLVKCSSAASTLAAAPLVFILVIIAALFL